MSGASFQAPQESHGFALSCSVSVVLRATASAVRECACAKAPTSVWEQNLIS